MRVDSFRPFLLDFGTGTFSQKVCIIVRFVNLGISGQANKAIAGFAVTVNVFLQVFESEFKNTQVREKCTTFILSFWALVGN